MTSLFLGHKYHFEHHLTLFPFKQMQLEMLETHTYTQHTPSFHYSSADLSVAT